MTSSTLSAAGSPRSIAVASIISWRWISGSDWKKCAAISAGSSISPSSGRSNARSSAADASSASRTSPAVAYDCSAVCGKRMSSRTRSQTATRALARCAPRSLATTPCSRDASPSSGSLGAFADFAVWRDLRGRTMGASGLVGGGCGGAVGEAHGDARSAASGRRVRWEETKRPRFLLGTRPLKRLGEFPVGNSKQPATSCGGAAVDRSRRSDASSCANDACRHCEPSRPARSAARLGRGAGRDPQVAGPARSAMPLSGWAVWNGRDNFDRDAGVPWDRGVSHRIRHLLPASGEVLVFQSVRRQSRALLVLMAIMAIALAACSSSGSTTAPGGYNPPATNAGGNNPPATNAGGAVVTDAAGGGGGGGGDLSGAEAAFANMTSYKFSMTLAGGTYGSMLSG